MLGVNLTPVGGYYCCHSMHSLGDCVTTTTLSQPRHCCCCCCIPTSTDCCAGSVCRYALDDYRGQPHGSSTQQGYVNLRSRKTRYQPLRSLVGPQQHQHAKCQFSEYSPSLHDHGIAHSDSLRRTRTCGMIYLVPGTAGI